jgi:hypothetical protein
MASAPDAEMANDIAFCFNLLLVSPPPSFWLPPLQPSSNSWHAAQGIKENQSDKQYSTLPSNAA